MSTKNKLSPYSISLRDLSPKFIPKSNIQNPKSTVSQGFTLVEVAIVMPIVILVIGTLLSAILAMTNNVLITRANNALIFSVQDALDRIEADVEVSGGYLAENNFEVEDGQSVNNSGGKFSSIDALILNSYSTTENTSSATRELVYKSVSGSCTSSTEPLMYNTVYFVKDETLWRRIVMPMDEYNAVQSGTGCKKPWQLPSCQATNTFCTAKDEKLVSGVTGLTFSIEYLDSSNSTVSNITNPDPAIRQAAMATATSIKITIDASGKTGGKTYTYSGTVRASSPNNNIDS